MDLSGKAICEQHEEDVQTLEVSHFLDDSVILFFISSFEPASFYHFSTETHEFGHKINPVIPDEVKCIDQWLLGSEEFYHSTL